MNIRKVDKIGVYNRTVQCMADKSMSVRAVLFNAYAAGSATVRNLLLSDDVLSAVDCARRLGAKIVLDGNTAHITGTGGVFNGCTLDCGNSGTTARLLIGLLSGIDGEFVLDGDASLRSRPMRRVTDPLKSMGANITDSDGKLPITVKGAKLRGINYRMPVASAQVKSALLLAGLNASSPVTVREDTISRDHSENMLADMGADLTRGDGWVTINKSDIAARDFTVPGDVSSATYPMSLALMTGGKCTVKNVGINPTRTGIFDVFESMGASVLYTNITEGGEPTADVTVFATHGLKPFTIEGGIVPRLIDEIPALCALACFADGTSVVRDAKELKVKETDRISATVAAISALGGDITGTDDGMIVRGNKQDVKFGRVDSKLDHRIAMSAAIAGAAGQGAEIIDADCATVSYPRFFEEVIGD